MIICEAKQGSDEWLADRAGCTTASDAGDAIAIVGGLDERQAAYVAAIRGGASESEAMTQVGYKAKPRADAIERALKGLPVGEPSDPAIRLAARKAIERITGRPYGNSGGGFYATERGHEQEAFARMRYESRFEVIVDEVGLCKTDDGLFGASFDGLVGDEGAIEVKTPADPLKLIRIIQTGDLSEYMPQIIAGFFVRGHKWTDVLIAAPELVSLNNGNELWVKRVYRDDAAVENMKAGLWEHEARIRRFEAILRAPYTQAANDLIERAAA